MGGSVAYLSLRCVACNEIRRVFQWLDAVSPVCLPCWVKRVFKELDIQEIEYTEKKM